jgi:hypothetical protein
MKPLSAAELSLMEGEVASRIYKLDITKEVMKETM